MITLHICMYPSVTCGKKLFHHFNGFLGTELRYEAHEYHLRNWNKKQIPLNPK